MWFFTFWRTLRHYWIIRSRNFLTTNVQIVVKFAEIIHVNLTSSTTCTHDYYDPAAGRFLSRDTGAYNAGCQDPRELNRYAYVAGNPVNWRDPSGYSIGETNLLGRISIGLKRSLAPLLGSSNFKAGFIGGIAGWMFGKALINIAKALHLYEGNNPCTNDSCMFWHLMGSIVVEPIWAGLTGGFIEWTNNKIFVQRALKWAYRDRFAIGQFIGLLSNSTKAFKDYLFREVPDYLLNDSSLEIIVDVGIGAVKSVFDGVLNTGVLKIEEVLYAYEVRVPGLAAFVSLSVHAVLLDGFVGVVEDVVDDNTGPF